MNTLNQKLCINNPNKTILLICDDDLSNIKYVYVATLGIQSKHICLMLTLKS
jgi:hypothetical protein